MLFSSHLPPSSEAFVHFWVCSDPFCERRDRGRNGSCGISPSEGLFEAGGGWSEGLGLPVVRPEGRERGGWFGKRVSEPGVLPRRLSPVLAGNL